MELVFGKMDVSTMANGLILQCMVMVFIHGIMEENLKEISRIIKDQEKVSKHGLMDVYMTEIGAMVNNMA